MKRRDFLQNVAAATAWTVAAGQTTAQTDEGDQPIRIGQIGTKHAHAAGQMETMRKLSQQYQVVGCVEPDAEHQQRVANLPAYQGITWLTEQQLVSTPGLAAVAVETEVRDLVPTAQRCIDAGLHVHVDKPAGESLAALRRLHESAAANQRMIQMGYMFRYNPAFRFLFQAVQQGWLGTIFEVHGVISKATPSSDRSSLARYGGGSMFELGCHLIDPLVYILGKPDRVTSFVRKMHPDQDSLADNMLAVLEYPKATATVRSSLVEVDGGQRRQLIVCGEEGTIEIRPLEPPQIRLTLAKERGVFRQGAQTVDLPPTPGRYEGAFLDMAQVIRGKKRPDFTHEHDLNVHETLLRACDLPLE